ncbi:MAG: cytidylate kinase family protein [Candidatus Thermoplasmatota archaeon]|nr:cytidylate kinase family protein [Candidatus Thermoplasmatota archaeon]
MLVTIGGLPGTGTTTAAYLLAEKTKMAVVSAGETFRQMAREKGISLGDYGKMAEADDSIDRELDRRMLDMAKKNDALILEGRLIGALCKKENVAVLGVWLHAPVEVRAARISGRESTDMEKTMHDMLEREKSEHTRYLRFYGIDNRDPQIYDLVIDSNANDPETIVSMIMEAMG